MANTVVDTDKRYVGVKETLTYGLANAGQVFGYNLVASGGYLSLFFTKVFGVPTEAVASMIFFLGIWDTINDPLMGSIVDKTRTRYGKLRPYLMFVPLPLAISIIFLFAGPVVLGDNASSLSKILYMYISYFIWEFFYTIGDIPFWGLSAAISPSPCDRTRAISSARIISSIIGGISTPMLVVLMDLSNNGTISLPLTHVFLLMAVLSAIFCVGLFSLAGFKTKERVVQSIKEPSVIDGFKVLFKNKPLMLIVISNVIGAITGIGGVFQAYYYSEVMEMNSLVIIIAIPGTVLGFLTYLLIPLVKKRFDNRQIMFLNGFARLIVGSAVFFIGAKHFKNVYVVVPLLCIQNLVFSFFDTIKMVIPTEMIGDTIDYMEWKTGERNEGVSFSVLTFVGKLTGSMSTALGTALLPLIGLSFQKISATETITIKQYANTDLYIWGLFTFAPVILNMFTLIPYIWYDLTGEKLNKIRGDMAERRAELSKQMGGNDNEQQ